MVVKDQLGVTLAGLPDQALAWDREWRQEVELPMERALAEVMLSVTLEGMWVLATVLELALLQDLVQFRQQVWEQDLRVLIIEDIAPTLNKTRRKLELKRKNLA